MLINLACVFIALIGKCFSNDLYFVSLKASESIDHFMEYDKRYPKHLQVRDFISNSIAIGDFKGFSGDSPKILLIG